MSEPVAHACPFCQCVAPDIIFHPYCPEPNAIPIPDGCPDRNTHISANWDAFYADFLTRPNRDLLPYPIADTASDSAAERY